MFIFTLHSTDLTTQDPAYYTLLTSGLTAEQQKSLHELMVLADQKKAQIQSRLIEKQGGKLLIFFCKSIIIKFVHNMYYTGYAFPQQTVPTSFQFGGA